MHDTCSHLEKEERGSGVRKTESERESGVELDEEEEERWGGEGRCQGPGGLGKGAKRREPVEEAGSSRAGGNSTASPMCTAQRRTETGTGSAAG